MAQTPKMISASQVNTYLNCPYQWYLRYIKKAEPVTVSPWLEFGSEIHSKISKLDFVHDDERVQDMLNRAKVFLSEMPDNPIFETTFKDPNNPGKFFGKINGVRAIAIFDAHWRKPNLGVDWKTGKFHKNYTGSHEVQAYFCSQLFEQKYNEPLEAFYFNFIAGDDQIYKAKVTDNKRTRTSVEKKINKFLDGVQDDIFPRTHCKLCDGFCDYAGICNLELED